MYQLFCVRKNKFSGQKQYKIGNRPLEAAVGSLFSKVALSRKRTLVFKQDTEEVRLTKECLEKLIKANGLERYFGNVKVIVFYDTMNVFLFMNLDQTLFISTEAIEVANKDEHQLSLLLAHELSHYLLEHQVSRISSAFVLKYVFPLFARSARSTIIDPTVEDFRAKTQLQTYSCYYPTQKYVDKYKERHCD